MGTIQATSSYSQPVVMALAYPGTQAQVEL
jgi:hypothetical protein